MSTPRLVQPSSGRGCWLSTVLAGWGMRTSLGGQRGSRVLPPDARGQRRLCPGAAAGGGACQRSALQLDALHAHPPDLLWLEAFILIAPNPDWQAKNKDKTQLNTSSPALEACQHRPQVLAADVPGHCGLRPEALALGVQLAGHQAPVEAAGDDEVLQLPLALQAQALLEVVVGHDLHAQHLQSMFAMQLVTMRGC